MLLGRYRLSDWPNRGQSKTTGRAESAELIGPVYGGREEPGVQYAALGKLGLRASQVYNSYGKEKEEASDQGELSSRKSRDTSSKVSSPLSTGRGSEPVSNLSCNNPPSVILIFIHSSMESLHLLCISNVNRKVKWATLGVFETRNPSDRPYHLSNLHLSPSTLYSIGLGVFHLFDQGRSLQFVSMSNFCPLSAPPTESLLRV